MGVVFVDLSVRCGLVVVDQERATSYAWVLQTSRDCSIPVSSGSISGVWWFLGCDGRGAGALFLVFGHGIFGIVAPVVGW